MSKTARGTNPPTPRRESPHRADGLAQAVVIVADVPPPPPSCAGSTDKPTTGRAEVVKLGLKAHDGLSDTPLS